MPLRALPLRLSSLEALPGRAPVVELPMGFSGDDLAAMYRGMYHGRPVVNGYSGFFPPSYDVLRLGFALRDPQMFDVAHRLRSRDRRRRHRSRPGGPVGETGGRASRRDAGACRGGSQDVFAAGRLAGRRRSRSRRVCRFSPSPRTSTPSACRSCWTGTWTRAGTAARSWAPKSSPSTSARREPSMA